MYQPCIQAFQRHVATCLLFGFIVLIRNAWASSELDVDKCTDYTANCHANATCTNTTGSFTCACNSGFTGNGMTCTDVDECNDATDNCHANAVCTNTQGSFICACNTGYTGNGVTCTDVDECFDATDNCHAYSACTNTPGSFTCACSSGYISDGLTCTDVDECSETTSNCHVNAVCTNMPGFFKCDCNGGYSGNGATCTDVDECTDTTDNCHVNAACTNTQGTFTCACNGGYTGDGVTCTDVDECFDNNNNCHSSADCTNMSGSFKCTCNSGYTGDGVTCAVMDLIERLRKNVTTSMSSQYLNWSSDKAIDGSNLTDPDTCDCCSGTQNAANSWWQLDLGQRYPIQSIQLYGRIIDHIYHQFEGFHLYLSNLSTTTEPPYYSDDMSSSGYFFNVSVPHILVQFITVKRPGILTMCEVKVSEGEACELSNGKCRSDCSQLNSGELCQDILEDSSFISATVIGYITGGVSFLVLLVCIVAVIIRKKRKESVYTRPNPQLSTMVDSLYDTIRELSASERQDIEGPVYVNGFRSESDQTGFSMPM